MKKLNNKGFSLIELIIVIAIMAVLVAVIAPNLTSYLGSSKRKTDNNNADTIESAISAQLQALASDEEIGYVALPTTYQDVNAILAAANQAVTGGATDIATATAFEKLVADNIPKKYIDANNELITKQDNYAFWIEITGDMDNGFTCRVKCDDAGTRPSF